jgi:hypothetical protein
MWGFSHLRSIMPTTGAGKFPYPNSSAAPDVPGDLLLLASRVDKIAGAGTGWTADATTRAALVTATDAFEGMTVYQNDTGARWRYLSAAWVAEDTGWVAITSFSGGGASDATYPCFYRVYDFGKQVKLRGVITHTAITTGSSAAICTLPAGARPASGRFPEFSLVPNVSNRVGKMTITSAGVLTTINATISAGNVSATTLDSIHFFTD